MIEVGVLELQGNYAMHHKIFSDLGIRSKGVKLPKHLDGVDGLVIPGGESTTMSLLLDTFRLRSPIKDFAKNKPIMGTCAGLIMMAKNIENESKVVPLKVLDITVNRNAYGRQIMSNKVPINLELNNESICLDATLIRAPKITELSDNVMVLAMIKNFPAVILQGMHLGMSFHPELDGVTIFHEILFNSSSKFYWSNLNKVDAA
ncbi:MAG: pyridoxal 5'-phosphate synthase glutaminase subunit PdxT [Candidatus Marinimicrobia bacterium]|nr:pyridoxal 5'-phosphate synthase glutaminase subunit PdxT [Candidatus Neomarinimicrobiota bacterium]